MDGLEAGSAALALDGRLAVPLPHGLNGRETLPNPPVLLCGWALVGRDSFT